MATNLLSDELKSDMSYLVPPITQEQIAKEVNALIFHFKTFGICFESDINLPPLVPITETFYLLDIDSFYLLDSENNNLVVKGNSSTEYESVLDKVTEENIVKFNHGQIARDLIDNLRYIYLPVDLREIVTNLNIIIEILKSGDSPVVSSFYFENTLDYLYKYTPSIKNRNGYSNLGFENNLSTKILALNKILLPVKYSVLIETINYLIRLFKEDSRIIDANDFKLLIYALKKEERDNHLTDKGIRDYGNSSKNGEDDTIFDYGDSTSTSWEFQSNFNLDDIIKEINFDTDKIYLTNDGSPVIINIYSNTDWILI